MLILQTRFDSFCVKVIVPLLELVLLFIPTDQENVPTPESSTEIQETFELAEKSIKFPFLLDLIVGDTCNTSEAGQS